MRPACHLDCLSASLSPGPPTQGRACRRPRLSARGDAAPLRRLPPAAARGRERRAATSGSATGAASPQPQPIFRPGGGHKPAAGRALSRLARVPFARHP